MNSQSGKIAEIVESLDREEKLALVRGAPDPKGISVGYLSGVDSANVPELRLIDGPLGVSVWEDSSTAFPASIAAAATFDPDLVRRQGAAMGRETKNHGLDVLLAPGLNLIRVPHCGRNFEYYSEDPLLTGSIAAAAVEGIQSEDVIATPKHFVANNQETLRREVSAEVSERALRELYLPGFHDAVDAGARAVMTSYNRVNGTHMSDHRELVTGVLKEEWGFDGFVMSDWYGTASTAGAANAGLDVEMPGVSRAELGGMDGDDEEMSLEDFEEFSAEFESLPDDPEEVAEVVKDALEGDDFGGDSPMEEGMPDASQHGLFGDPLDDAIEAGEVPEERLNDMVARVLGAMEWAGLFDGGRDGGTVAKDEHHQIAREIAARGTVLLENEGVLPLADDTDIALIGPNVEEVTLGGGGSSEIQPVDPCTTAEGISERAGGVVTVHKGAPRILTPSSIEVMFGFGDAEFGQSDEDVDMDVAIDAAADADVAIVVVRDWASEAADRDDLRLPGNQDELVEAVADANEQTVAVVQSSGPIELPWREDVAAILASWYPGEVDGEALADVLFGDTDPGGRLPVTFAPEPTYPASEDHQFPGDDGVLYEEGVFVGYRHFDAADADPTYPFGYGQSYADFEYRDAELVDDSTARVTIENVAERDGREVVQAYVRPPTSDVDRPERELAGFHTVDVGAGETATVDLDLDERAFAYWDGGWTVEQGEYTIELGRSSQDHRLSVRTQC